VEDKGFDKSVDQDVVGKLMAGASVMMPAISEARVCETWAGLRPRSADDLPILGPVAGGEGLIGATGHFRNGILLAPITAQLVTAWVTGQPTAAEAGRFSPDRFAVSTLANAAA
jgi:glycine oxidase